MAPERKKRRKIPSRDQALTRMAGLCAAAEQCRFDIAAKLRKMELTPADTEAILDTLEERGFLSETRYAGSFARDKVRFNAWGKRKIAMMLMAKRISRDTITEALASIDHREYMHALSRATITKGRTLDMEEYDDRAKLYRYIVARGFEPDLASRAVERYRKYAGRE